MPTGDRAAAEPSWRAIRPSARPRLTTVFRTGTWRLLEALVDGRQPGRAGGAGDRAGCAATSCPRALGGVGAQSLRHRRNGGERRLLRRLNRWLPIVFVFVLSLSFILLTVVFRSIVVPVKAIVMNLLSVGAAYGLIVLVFQEGVGNELFGFQQVDAIEAWLPLFLFSILFGLSMDYHVFLLSRIRERFDQTGDTNEAVAFGVRSTARMITGAALIIVASSPASRSATS